MPALISRRLLRHSQGGLEEFAADSREAAAEEAAAEEAAAGEALLHSNTELFALVASPERPFEDFRVSDIWDKLNTYVTAIGRGSYLCHQGDWEHVTLFLNPENELADPLTVGFDAHGKKSRAHWEQLDEEDGRLVVYSGRGSHASLPKPGSHWKTGDVGDVGGLRWRTWNWLEPVTQDWWGFGGAWGRVGEVGDLTGPLGPSPYKGQSRA